MFINPMWYHESERVGKQRCTPTGYMLHVISDLIGFIALICLLGVLIYLVYARIRGQFTWGMLWFLVVPFTIAIAGNILHSYSWYLADIAGNILHSYSWYLADKHQFKYDYEKAISTWVNESGVQQSYKYGTDADKTDQPDLQ